MKAIVITLLCCATALGCALILRNRLPHVDGSKSSDQHEHYKLVQFDEQWPTGFSDRSIFKIETNSGRTWRLNKQSIPSRLKTLDGKEGGPITVEGWEQIRLFDDGWNEAWLRAGALPSPTTPSKATATPTSSPR